MKYKTKFVIAKTKFFIGLPPDDLSMYFWQRPTVLANANHVLFTCIHYVRQSLFLWLLGSSKMSSKKWALRFELFTFVRVYLGAIQIILDTLVGRGFKKELPNATRGRECHETFFQNFEPYFCIFTGFFEGKS